MLLTPLHNNLIVKKDMPKGDIQTRSGIFLKEIDTKATEWGKVIVTGPQVETIKKNMNVVFNSFDRDELTMEGCEDLVIIKEDKILASFK